MSGLDSGATIEASVRGAGVMPPSSRTLASKGFDTTRPKLSEKH
ncbi:hypothetical protein OHB44_00100 [Micromonospora sp. NBC_00821]|nr:hypothetical protein OHB44_00100 [Micromonospora sp. NBC_00821]